MKKKPDRRRAPSGPIPVERRERRDRRQAERVVVDLPVDYRWEGTFLYAYITDLSALGLFVRSNSPYAVGSHITLRFQLPGEGTVVDAEGEVMWISPLRMGHFEAPEPGMGVRFIDPSPGLKEKLLALVQHIAYLDNKEA